MTHLMPTTPRFCSSCFGQYPDRRHVDFDAAWDGPMINSDDGIRMNVDDLQICEECLREAAALVGMVDDATSKTMIGSLETEAAINSERIADLEAEVHSLQEALSAQITPPRPVGRPKKVAA